MKIAKSLGVATIAASLSLASLLPASAAPLGVPGNVGLTAPITLAASRDDWRRGDNRRSYKGYQGSRDYRRGYRRNNDGWWYPLAAFGLGAAIGSTFSQPRVYQGGNGNGHVDWCYSRWQSYRAYDNTYQPFNGPRRLCNSPYG